MTGKQLKNSILQWAIQGKLVPQDPNDEPASVLLEKIRAEKAQLIKEGKIKKDKEESIIYRGEDNSYYEKFALTGEVKCIDEEIPFDLPKGWVWCRLREIALIIGGYAFSSESLKSSQGVRIIRISDFNEQGWVNKSVTRYNGEKILSQYEIQTKDILLAMTGGTVGKSFFVFEVPERMYLNQRVAIIRVTKIHSEHANILLKSPFITDLISNIKNSTNENISIRDVSSFLFPLPPLAEQQRIVAKIEELMPLVEQYGKAQSELEALNSNIREQLKKSVLQYAIEGKLVPQCEEDGTAEDLLREIQAEKQRLYAEGKLKKKDLAHSTIFRGEDNKYYEQVGKDLIDITDEIPFEIPDSWIWTRIGYLFAHNNGKQLNKSNSVGTLMEYITTSNLYWDGFRLENLKRMPFEENEIERCQAIKGDLLVCEGGDVGRSCIWTNNSSIMLQNHIHKLRAYLPLCTKYFFYIFYMYNLFGLIGGKGIGIQGFSSKALHNTIVPLPPLKEQERIVKKIEAVFNKIKGD